MITLMQYLDYMKLYHGTTADALPSILKNGLRTDEGGANWNVSGSAVYFWSPDALAKVDSCIETFEDACFEAERRAIDNGEFGLGFSKDCRVVLLEIELDTELFDVQPDESCNNMEGAVCVFDDVPVSCIKAIQVSADLSLIRGHYLSLILGREMASRQYELSDMEEKVAKLFADSSIAYEVEDLRNMQDYPLPS